MNKYPSDVAFTPTVKAIQTAKGSRDAYARVEQGSGWKTELTLELTTFLSQQDMFYFGTSNSEGQPYIQYRGGPPGFLKVIDEKRLGFADFGGNRQFITTGNLEDNPKAFIFLMDYLNQKRIKLWGHAHVVENDEVLAAQLSHPEYPATVERVVLFDVVAWDVNCPQHIRPRIPLAVAQTEMQKLKDRIVELEQQLQRRDEAE